MKLPIVSKIIAGEWIIGSEVVHNTGKVIYVHIEKFTLDNWPTPVYVFFKHMEDGTYTNFVGYPTIRRARNAAARL